MVERPGSCTSDNQERRCPNNRYEIERKKEYELDDLSEGERRVYGTRSWLSEHLDCIRRILVEDSRWRYKINKAFVDQRGLAAEVSKGRP